MNNINLISLYTGAGGLDYGFEAAGFNTALAIEIDSDCCKTIRNNRSWPIIEKDISLVSYSDILDISGLNRDHIDLVIGGPPCQPFSKAGYWVNGDTKRLNDPRANTLYEYMRCVDELLPSVFVIENVHGINYSGKEEGFKLIEEYTDKINKKHGTKYKLVWKVINTADYGVPQIRTRFFLVAQREGKRFNFPEPTHVSKTNELNLLNMPAYTTAWDAIGNITIDKNENLNLRGRWADLLPSIPEGENYLWHTERKGGIPLFGWRTRYWSFLLKLAKDRPSWTIQAQPGPAIGPFHWDNRLLSINELAALQTFPKDIQFFGSRASVQKQIGNAVPSLMAEIIARAIGNQFFGLPLGTFKLAVAPKRPIPPASPVLPVPEKYMSLLKENPGA